jgi:uncharacterized membrane protein YkvA (DUF1232 family)
MESKEQRFLGRLREKMIALPYDLKGIHGIITNEDLPDEARRLAVGTVIYVLGQNDLIPDHLVPVGYVDDTLLVWIVLEHFQRSTPEVLETPTAALEELKSSIEETARIFRDYLGPHYEWLVGKIEGFPRLIYKGKTTDHYFKETDGADFLYQEILAFTSDFDLDEDYLSLRLGRGKIVLDALAKRSAEEQLRRR